MLFMITLYYLGLCLTVQDIGFIKCKNYTFFFFFLMEEKERVVLLLCLVKGEHRRLDTQELCTAPGSE